MCILYIQSKFSLHNMLLLQLVHSRLVNIFSHHGASSFSPPLLSVKGPLFSEMDSIAQLMDRNGAIVVLPTDHRVSQIMYMCVYACVCTYISVSAY